jgi:3',5'-cyclic AMP phosphodiesterase CpdA
MPRRRAPLKRLSIQELLRPHHKALGLGLIAVIVEGIAGLLEPWPLKIVLDNVVKQKALSGWLNSLVLNLALDSGVKFYASLGNHDSPNQVFYKPFNMNGRRYYDFRRGDAAFFALDSNYMDPDQLAWLRKELTASDAKWKICYFHHPLYSHARMHGSDTDLRKTLEPLFEETGVRVVLSGHEHVYERVKPQHGIYYFVLGSSGELRLHDLRPSPDTAKGFDTDNAFAVFEITDDGCYFQVISRRGLTVDSGAIPSLLIEKSWPSNSLALQHHERNALGGADLLQRVAVHHQ